MFNVKVSILLLLLGNGTIWLVFWRDFVNDDCLVNLRVVEIIGWSISIEYAATFANSLDFSVTTQIQNNNWKSIKALVLSLIINYKAYFRDILPI